MSRSHALLIINPNSRRAGDEDVKAALTSLEQGGLTLIHAAPNNREHTYRLIADHRERVDRVIVAGGDGTLNSSAKALSEFHLPLAILPVGTANDLARSLGIPQELPAACRVILNNQRRKVDLGWVNGHYFFNVANIGLGTRITHELTPKVKKEWGVFSYLKALCTAWSEHRDFRVRMRIDGKEYRLRSIQLAVGNGRYYGGGNIVDEAATIQDGLLDLYSLSPQSWWKLMWQAPLLRDGRQHQAERIFTASGKRIEIRTSRVMEVHADGEPLTRTPADFAVLERAIEVIAPPIDCPNIG